MIKGYIIINTIPTDRSDYRAGIVCELTGEILAQTCSTVSNLSRYEFRLSTCLSNWQSPERPFSNSTQKFEGRPLEG